MKVTLQAIIQTDIIRMVEFLIDNIFRLGQVDFNYIQRSVM